jgi:pimeloyl-ACP methyl ester carboxylesterase
MNKDDLMDILKRLWWGIKLALLLVCGFSGVALGAAPEDIVGTWQGQLEVGAVKLRILFNISVAPDGKLSSTLDSPDQGANGIPVDVTTFDGSELRIEVHRIQGTFEGTLKADEKVIEGAWTQGRSLPLTLRPGQRVAWKRPQEPQKPYPYVEEEVAYDSLKTGPRFAGTLTKPQGNGRFPAVLLITGSGPQNRDEELVGHKPFLVIADDLTRRGIAVLRVDDRGVGGTTGDMKTATSSDFVEDVLAGVAFLKSRADVDPRRIGLVGHSEGGLIAPMAAVRSPDVAFIVMIAGPGMRGRELLAKQATLIAAANGASPAMVTNSNALMEQMLDVVLSEPDNAAAAVKMSALWAKAQEEAALSTTFSSVEKAAIKAADAQMKQQLAALTTPWMRNFLAYDPQPVLRQVRVPVLALTGSLDLQVPAKENLRAIGEALSAGGNKDHTEIELPGLNHLLQTAKTGSPVEYAVIEETMSPKALSTMGEWIVARTSR